MFMVIKCEAYPRNIWRCLGMRLKRR
jgi:hypothetical protein